MNLSMITPLVAAYGEWAYENAPAAEKMVHLFDGLFQGGGNHGMAAVAAGTVLLVLFLRDRSSGSSKSSSTGGGKLLPLGLIAVAAVVFFNGGV